MEYTFKTSIKSKKKAANIENLLPHYFFIQAIHFDFTSLKSVLTIKSSSLSPIKVQNTIEDFGYSCELVSNQD
jgi:hypothetical protein